MQPTVNLLVLRCDISSHFVIYNYILLSTPQPTLNLTKPKMYSFSSSRFRITLRPNFSNVNTSACIYPPLKQNPPLKSSQNNLSNGGSSAVKTLHKPKQSYIYTHHFVKHSNEKKTGKVEYLINFSSFSERLYV